MGPKSPARSAGANRPVIRNTSVSNTFTSRAVPTRCYGAERGTGLKAPFEVAFEDVAKILEGRQGEAVDHPSLSQPRPGRMRASSTHRHYWRKIRYANIPLLHLRHRSAGSTSGCDDLTKSADWRLSPMPELGERVRIFTLTGQTGHGENRLSDNGTRPRTYSTEAMAAPRRKALKTARALITEGGYSLSPCGRSAPGRRRQTDLVQYLRKPG